MRRARFVFLLAMFLTLLLLIFGCQREQRNFRQAPSSAGVVNTIQVSDLHPGGQQIATPAISNRYEESAYAVSQGKQLFEQFNCVGCHANGGGGIGPPLMDNQWIYGGEPANIFSTIMEGRPNGMPAWRGRIPENQAWEIVAYVRSLSGLLAKDVAPGRSDHMSGKRPPANTPRQIPTGITGAPEQKQ
jgi:cytochrome c oxidase cbb3-type subunit 3